MLQGSMVAMITPMSAEAAVDEAALRGLVGFHIGQGTAAIVAVGTTGESATLDFDEHIRVIQITVEAAAGRVPVIAGTGANSTREAIELTAAARQAGADACLLVTPYYNKPTQQGLYLHHEAIANAVAIPQILYNVPGRTACDMSVETVARLSAIDNIIGIKDATGEIDRVAATAERAAAGFLLFSGDDDTAMEFMLGGGHGVISVTANVAPKAMRRMCDCALAGDRAGAEAANASLSALHRALFAQANPIPVKWAVEQMGLCQGGIRLPLTPLSADCHEAVTAAMRQAGVM